MKGKIASYDKVKGIGKIIVANQGVKTFKVDDWLDYSVTPQRGLEVEFGIQNGKIIDITTSNSSDELLNQLKEKFVYTMPVDLKIKENISIDTCLIDFFSKFEKMALKYKYLLKSTNKLPYKKLKRFIQTAYKNLLEVDAGINDMKLLDIRTSLEEVEHYFDILTKELKNPIYVLLGKLVLNKQQNYQVLKKRLDTNKDLIIESTTQANLLEMKINKLKEELKKFKPKSKEYVEQDNLLKSYKKKYVDLIDMAQNLRDENSQIVDDVNQFETFYKDVFEKFFTKEVKVLLVLLEQEMNVLAYEFDSILWENAKKSKGIQHFFEQAKIEGSYSTKTFMKYYLKSLSSDKMNERDRDLLKILDELKVFAKNIIIFERKRQAEDLSRYIENLDHNNSVEVFNDFKSFVVHITNNDANLDIVLIEIGNSNKTLIIQKVLPILENIGIKTILFSDEIESENIMRSSELTKKLKYLL